MLEGKDFTGVTLDPRGFEVTKQEKYDDNRRFYDQVCRLSTCLADITGLPITYHDILCEGSPEAKKLKIRKENLHRILFQSEGGTIKRYIVIVPKVSYVEDVYGYIMEQKWFVGKVDTENDGLYTFWHPVNMRGSTISAYINDILRRRNFSNPVKSYIDYLVNFAKSDIKLPLHRVEVTSSDGACVEICNDYENVKSYAETTYKMQIPYYIIRMLCEHPEEDGKEFAKNTSWYCKCSLRESGTPRTARIDAQEMHNPDGYAKQWVRNFFEYYLDGHYNS